MAGILLPIDLKEGALEAFREAMELARALRLRVELLHAVSPGSSDPQGVAARAAERLQDLLLANGDEHLSGGSVRQARPAEAIAARARALAPDLLVLRAPRRPSGWARLGSSSWVCFVPWRSAGAAPVSPWRSPDRLAHHGLLLLGLALFHRLWALSQPAAWGASAGITLLAAAGGAALLLLSWLAGGPVPPRARRGPAAESEIGPILAVMDAEGRLPDLSLVGRLARGLRAGGPAAGVLLVHIAVPERAWSERGAGGALGRFRSLLGRDELRGVPAGCLVGTGEVVAELSRLVEELGASHLLLPDSFAPEQLDPLIERLRAPRAGVVWLATSAGACTRA